LFSIQDVDREYIWTYPTAFQSAASLDLSQHHHSWTPSEDMFLYVHVPFCKSDCTWCVFHRERYRDEGLENYVSALMIEIDAYARFRAAASRRVTAVYFGGGTASALRPHHLRTILDRLRGGFLLSEDVEITLECHPKTVDAEYLEEIYDLGVNRVSFGIQSFREDVLRSLRISQNADHNWRTIQCARAVGFPKVNMDLIYRVPGQTLDMLDDDLRLLAKSGVTGVSCYSLEARETRFDATGQPDDVVDHEMFYLIDARLSEYGLRRFAQPDFSLPGLECRYIQCIWGAPQAWGLAFGPSGLSLEFNGFTFFNVSGVEQYVELLENGSLPVVAAQRVDRDEAMARYFVLGVRCLRVPRSPFRSMFGADPMELPRFAEPIDQLHASGLVEVDDNAISLTRRGLYFVDNISKMFYTDACHGSTVPWGQLEIGRGAPGYPRSLPVLGVTI
jgi:oxygen-independent coproporphyrinogen III oxidase